MQFQPAAPEQACGLEVGELPLVTAPVGEPGCERGLELAAMHAQESKQQQRTAPRNQQTGQEDLQYPSSARWAVVCMRLNRFAANGPRGSAERAQNSSY